jgi:hypothetical protein
LLSCNVLFFLFFPLILDYVALPCLASPCLVASYLLLFWIVLYCRLLIASQGLGKVSLIWLGSV